MCTKSVLNTKLYREMLTFLSLEIERCVKDTAGAPWQFENSWIVIRDDTYTWCPLDPFL